MPTGDPNARYRTPHRTEIGRIRIESRTSSALLERVSSSSRGSAPIRAERARMASATVRRRLAITPQTVLLAARLSGACHHARSFSYDTHDDLRSAPDP